MRERVAVGVRREQKPKKKNLEGFSAGCVEQNGENGGEEKYGGQCVLEVRKGKKKKLEERS